MLGHRPNRTCVDYVKFAAGSVARQRGTTLDHVGRHPARC